MMRTFGDSLKAAKYLSYPRPLAGPLPSLSLPLTPKSTHAFWRTAKPDTLATFAVSVAQLVSRFAANQPPPCNHVLFS